MSSLRARSGYRRIETQPEMSIDMSPLAGPRIARRASSRSLGWWLVAFAAIALLFGSTADHTPAEQRVAAGLGLALAATGLILLLGRGSHARRRVREGVAEAEDAWPTGTDHLETVWKPASLAEQVAVESLLRSAQIAFVTQTTAAQSLFGVGRVGGTNLLVGPPQIQVGAADAARAAELLHEARESLLAHSTGADATTAGAEELELPSELAAEEAPAPVWPGTMARAVLLAFLLLFFSYMFAPTSLLWAGGALLALALLALVRAFAGEARR